MPRPPQQALEWAAKAWDEGALLQTGMDGKAIQAEKI